MKQASKLLHIVCIMALMAMPALNASAQNKPIMDIQPDVKTVYPDRMGLAPNTTLAEVLQMLPEFTMHGTNSITDAYSLEVDGKTYNLDIEAYLARTRISEVEKIALSTNGISAGVPGIMGCIKVTTVAVRDGVHGGVDVAVSTSGDVAPAAGIAYGKGPWRTYAELSASYARDHTETDSYTAGNNTMSNINSWDKPIKEVFKWHTAYNTDKNTFNLKLSQSLDKENTKDNSYTNGYADGVRISRIYDEHTSRNHNLTAELIWKHIFNSRHNISLNINYGYNNSPDESWEQTPYGATDADIDNLHWGRITVDQSTNKYAAEATYSGQFSSWINLDAAINYQYQKKDLSQMSETVIDDMINAPSYLLDNIDIDNNSNNLQGYAQLTMLPDTHWRIIIGERGRYVNNNLKSLGISEKDINFSCWQTAAMVGYTPVEHHSIVAGYNRRMTMPTTTQLYDQYVVQENASNLSYLKGNSELKAPTYDIINIGYSYQNNPWAVTAEGRYYHASNIITTESASSLFYNREIKLYNTVNKGSEDVFMINTSGSWYNDWLSVLLGLNYTHSNPSESSTTNIFSVRFMANVDCGQGWTASLSNVFTSGVHTATTKTDGEWYGALAAGKSWKHIDLALRLENYMNRAIYTRIRNSVSYTCQQTNGLALRASLSWRF